MELVKDEGLVQIKQELAAPQSIECNETSVVLYDMKDKNKSCLLNLRFDLRFLNPTFAIG